MKKIICYACIKDSNFRLSVIEYEFLSNGSLDLRNKKEFFWANEPSIEDILKNIPREIPNEQLRVHNGARLSMKKGKVLTDECFPLSRENIKKVEDFLQFKPALM